MQDTQENRFVADDAKMREALRSGNARSYAVLCDRLGIPSNARNPHLYSEGKRLANGSSDLRRSSYVGSVASPGLDVSSCILSQAAVDYLKSLGDKGLEREDYMERVRHVVKLGGAIPDSLRPKVGATEEEWHDLYFALAGKARSVKSNFLEF